MSRRKTNSDLEDAPYDLKEEIQEMGLENLYQQYCANIYRNYLNSLTIFHLLMTFTHEIAISILRKDRIRSRDHEILVTACGAILAMLCLRPYMKVQFERDHPFLKYVISWTATLIMAAPDLCTNLYNLYTHKAIHRPLYAGYVVSVAYLFMPIPGLWHPLFLGGFLTFLYCSNIVYVTISYEDDDTEYASMIVPDIIYLIGLNLIGVYIRWRRSILRCIAFLTTRNQVEQTLICKYAKGQEQTLLLSIIPERLAIQISKDISSRLQLSRSSLLRFSTVSRVSEMQDLSAIPRKFFIEQHEDVSILFADVVNYTYISTQVDVKTLIELLHDLFQRFDLACQKFSTMRIKFLGDCYYCVSGMPVSHPLHAVCCVEMGLAIIENVREVKTLREVNIDMRVGIHSGNILAGIIGITKWQYDIWSKDVDIANRLEQTGIPGRVHISNATLNLIENYYEYESGTEEAKEDPVLVKYNIQTYVINKRTEYMKESKEWKNYLNSKENANDQLVINTVNSQHNIVFSQIVEQTNELMIKEIESLPICRMHFYETWFIRQPQFTAERMDEYHAKRSISKVFLLFESYFKECQFLSTISKRSVRYAVLLGFLILICVIISQAVNKIMQNIYTYYFINFLLIGVVSTLAFMKWRPIFLHRRKSIYVEGEYTQHDMQNSLKIITKNMVAYTTILIAILMASLTHVMICDEHTLENDVETLFLLVEEGIRLLCTNSWSITNSLVLFTAMALTWPNIPFCAMLISTGAILIVYCWMVFSGMTLSFESSLMTHSGVGAEFSHIWTFITIYVLYLINARHMIYLAKYNFYTQIEVERKIHHSKIANETIKVLLNNILPTHVVQLFLIRHRSTEPFYEHHNKVAVIFATIVHTSDSTKDIRVMNEIICEFDEILSSYKHPIKVEKIKVTSWTYMAACGFTVRKSSSIGFQRGSKTTEASRLSTFYSFQRRSAKFRDMQASIYINESDTDDNEDTRNIPSDESDASLEESRPMHDRLIIYIMTSFAIDLLKAVRNCSILLQRRRDLDEVPITLRVGISSGEIMAGIVGASVAHYDIWGSAVNMASRMDSTGIPGRIQVTEQEANILKSFNVECSYRGMTFVKGRGKIPTYFVETDENLDMKIAS